MESHSESTRFDWDFYLYVGITILNWPFDYFLRSTPANLMKQYVMHLRATNPDLIVDEDTTKKRVYTIDQTPFM